VLRLIDIFISFLRRRSPGARGRLAYRVLFDLMVAERQATRR
jgi:hypothetical protein